MNGSQPGPSERWFTLLWAAIFIGVPALAAWRSVPAIRQTEHFRPGSSHLTPRRTQPPPAIQPVALLAISSGEAQAINAAIPFSTAPNPAALPFRFTGDAAAQERAVDCLAAAELYEAGDDSDGEKAVAQVVINRVRHPAFPKTVCGVVFQGAERATGCQFTFTCDGALARTPPAAAWERAQKLARQMLSGMVDKRVGHATHYHTDWVVPYWSGSLDKITSIGTHLFFRWKGWWGMPGAFRLASTGEEPSIAKLDFLSPVHGKAASATDMGLPPLPATTDAGDPIHVGTAIDRDRIGDRFGVGRLAALNSTSDAFVMLLDRKAPPAAFEQLARTVCAGKAKCRMLGWTRTSEVPSSFPIDEASLATMSYSYLRAPDMGLERSLYNCKEFPDQPASRCMRDRTPTAPAAERTGIEVIRLTPSAEKPLAAGP